MSNAVKTLKMTNGSTVVWPVEHPLKIWPKKVWLLEVDEHDYCYDHHRQGVVAAYSSKPTKKQLVKKFKELGVKNSYEMVATGSGDCSNEVYESWMYYKVIEMDLL